MEQIFRKDRNLEGDVRFTVQIEKLYSTTGLKPLDSTNNLLQTVFQF
jgi:hypothetical protein